MGKGQKPVVNIGSSLIKDEGVVIGAQGRTRGDIVIGSNACLRSGTVIYEGVKVGDGFKTGHNVVVRENNIIGDNAVVGVNSYLGPGNRIGDNVNIHTGCFLEMAAIEDNVALGPHVVLTDDSHPRCPRFEECVGGVKIKEGAKIGANVTILPGVTIGENALIGSGSVVTKDVPSRAVVVGNPAKVIKTINELTCRMGFYKKVYEWEETDK